MLALIWFKPVRDLIKQMTTRAIVLFAATGTLLAGTTDSKAFFDKADKTEAYTILPNQSAFVIPDAGANQTTQAQFNQAVWYSGPSTEDLHLQVDDGQPAGAASNIGHVVIHGAPDTAAVVTAIPVDV